MKEKTVTVIIPAYNEEKDIGECLESLSKQSYRSLEIIIVDDGSTDKTIEIVSRFKNIKIIKGEHKGPGLSRNIGAKRAKGNILVFVDADMTFEKDYIKNLIAPIVGDNGIIGTTHEQEIVRNTDNIWSRCWGKIRVSKKSAKYVKVFRAIRKDKFLELGGFDPKYGYADDQTLWFKHKISPIVAKNTICYHKNPETLIGVYKQSKWIGASINNWMIEIPIIKYILPIIMAIFIPILIIPLAITKCYKNKDLKILLLMIIFMIFRYTGTLIGLVNKIYLNKNFR